MRITSKTKEIKLIVKARSAFGESINEDELNRFGRVCLGGFLKPVEIKKHVAVYTGPVGISLYERLKESVSKRDFLFIIEQIAVAVQKLQSNRMNVDNLIADIQHVFINEVTREINFIYLPSSERTSSVDLCHFVESIVYSAKPAEIQDNECIARFIYFFKTLGTFDPAKVERFVELEDRNVVNTIRKKNSGQSGYMTDKHRSYYEHYDKRKNGQQEEDDDDKTGLLSDDDEATGLLNEIDEEATGLLSAEEDGTALLDEEDANVSYPTLFRVLTGETISVNKPVFRLGKEKSYVDYFVTNNIAVSRSHADIITRGSSYFVKDLNSKNHTYINNERIPIQYEVELHSGDSLKLGNEEFIFNE